MCKKEVELTILPIEEPKISILQHVLDIIRFTGALLLILIFYIGLLSIPFLFLFYTYKVSVFLDKIAG